MDVKKTIEKYDQKIAEDAKIAELDRMAREGLNKWRAAEELASRTGLTTAQVLLSDLLEEYPDGKIPEDAARMLTIPVMKHNYDRVVSVAEAAQTATNEEAEIGLKALKPEFNKDRAEGLAKNISSWNNLTDHKDQVTKEIENSSRSIVDDTIKTNAAAHESAGLQALVTRIYDGVGLSNGRVCEWCLERCGEDMPYSEAYAKGAFQRHPGCGCELLYSVGKQTQRQTDWTKNEWEKVSSSAIIETRKNIGIENTFDIEKKEKTVTRFIGVNRDKLVAEAKTPGGPHHGVVVQSEEKTKKQLRDSINSHIDRVVEHTEKINNPEEHSERYKKSSDVGKQGIIRHWERDRRRNAEEALIEMEIYKERFEK